MMPFRIIKYKNLIYNIQINIKSEYDLIYKESNLDKMSKTNKSILLGLIILLLIHPKVLWFDTLAPNLLH